MERLNNSEIIKRLNSQGLSLFTIFDFKKLFAIKKDNTTYKTIARLTKKGILKRLTKKKYLFSLSSVDDFQITNFLYSPSYISLETALSFYGIITQFPYQITSITPRKTKTINALNKEFAYFHIKQDLFFGYEKKESFLIALPEKALLDYFYFCSKGLRNFEKDDFDLTKINKKIFAKFLKIANDKALNKFLDKMKINLCLLKAN